MLDFWCFIAEDSPLRADTFLDKLNEKIKLLATMPNMGVARDDLQENLRAFIYREYLIFHTVDFNQITILRIIHGSRDLEYLFSNGP